MGELDDSKQLKQQILDQAFDRIAHDLKTPLSVIIGSLSLLVSQGTQIPDESKNELMVQSLSEAQKLDRYLGNVLLAAKIEQNRIEPHINAVEQSEVFLQIQDLVSQNYPNFKWESSIAQSGQFVSLDINLLKQILTQLFENAKQFSEGPVTVSALAKESVSIAVLSSGPALPDEDLQTLFQKHKVSSLHEKTNKGLGLGLYIAKKLCDFLNMELTCQNTSTGLSFVVKI